MKVCLGCGKTKQPALFAKYKRNKSGYGPKCLDCESIRNKLYYEKNKDKINIKHKKYNKINKDGIKKYNKEYSKINKEELLEKGRERYRNNKIYILKRHKEYKKNNFEKSKEYARRRRAKKKNINEHYTKLDEQITRKVFNNMCFNCTNTKNLTIDHHYCLNKGHPLTVKNAVVLCASCNSSKGVKNPKEFYSTSQLIYLNKLLKSVDQIVTHKAEFNK